MKKILYYSAILISCVLLTQSGVVAQVKHKPVLNHIALYVFNLEKSTRFYRDVLELEITPEPFNDGKHTWFKIGDYSQLHLIEGAKQITPHEKSSHICFSVKSVKEFIVLLDKYKIDRINMKGDSKSPTIRPDGVSQIYFQDPDGYWIEVNDAKL
ncbi:VOC family protein [Daejeonella sp.]|uniref:VOC family protein n=1 Tax=Daejeonella sp. TaxID=2805397 RepID=UPI0030BEE249